MAQIRMLKSFKGYAEDSLQDFGSTENARLVSIGFASNDLDGPDGEAVQDRANLAAELAAIGALPPRLPGVGKEVFGRPLLNNPAYLSTSAGATIEEIITVDGQALRITGGTPGSVLNIDFTLPTPTHINTLAMCYQTTATTNNVRVYAANSVGLFNNYNNHTIGTASFNYSSQLNRVTLGSVLSPIVIGDTNTAAWSSTGPQSESTLRGVIRVGVTPEAGQLPQIIISRMSINPSGKGKVCITADDGRLSWYQYAIPLLEQRQLRCTMGIIPDYVGSANYMNLSQIKSLVDAGHEVVAHDSLAINGSSASAKIARLNQVRDQLRAWGLYTTAAQEECYIYPGGEYQLAAQDTAFLDAMRASGFYRGRGGYPKRLSASDFANTTAYGPLLQSIIGYGRGDTEAANNTLIGLTTTSVTDCANLGMTGVLMLHKIIADQGTFTQTAAEECEVSVAKGFFDAIVTQRATGKLTVPLFSEL